MAPPKGPRRAQSLGPPQVPTIRSISLGSRVTKRTTAISSTQARTTNPGLTAQARQTIDLTESTEASQHDSTPVVAHQHQIPQRVPLSPNTQEVQLSSSPPRPSSSGFEHSAMGIVTSQSESHRSSVPPVDTSPEPILSADHRAQSVIPVLPDMAQHLQVRSAISSSKMTLIQAKNSILYHVEGHRRLFKLNELFNQDQDTRNNYKACRDCLRRIINNQRREVFTIHSQLHVNLFKEADEVWERVKRIIHTDNGYEMYLDFEKQLETIKSHYHNEECDIRQEMSKKDAQIETLIDVMGKHDADYDEAVKRFRRRDAVRIMEMLGEIGIDGLTAQDDTALGQLKSIVGDMYSNSTRPKSCDQMESGDPAREE